MITLYNAISSDGFIARLDGSEDFISYEIWHDLIDLCKNYDAVVVGKNSYNAIQGYDENEKELFEKLPIKKVVISRDKKFIPKSGYIISRSIDDAVLQGGNILLMSGPT